MEQSFDLKRIKIKTTATSRVRIDGRCTLGRNAQIREGGYMRVVWLLSVALSTGCYDDVESSKLCREDSDCGDGKCVVAPVSNLLFCAENDRGCPTGQRWAENAGDRLAGKCVEAPSEMVDAGVDAVVVDAVDAAVPDAPGSGGMQ